ncbi:MAG: pyruvate, phosphate dikinase, partial [Chloroflexi bacterium]
MKTYVLPLTDPQATLETVGGKGMSLAKMARAAMPVPDGFHVTTEAYRSFVAMNDIQPRILEALKGLDDADLAGPAELETISQTIGTYFSNGTVSPEIARAVIAAYHEGKAVAVRSSATAEDLPGASFAGQQDTYLNICGAEAVLAAIKKCWASLWTARAIAYRARQGISPESVALAVVVQELVFADASGVLFTANPVSGKRDEMMITAAWGLGEALVGGLVTPDTLIVNKANGRVLHRENSKKQVMTVRTEIGTHEQPVPRHQKTAPVLSDSQAADLAKHGAVIEQLYGIPMDIEWTLANGRFAIVQARPVTSLPEPPLIWSRSNPKSMLVRGSFAEFTPDPVSPLFATLAVPIAQVRSQELMNVFLGVKDKDSYLFEVVNGYVYIGFLFTAKKVLQMTLVSITMSKKMLQSGRARWVVVRAKLHEAVKKWQRDLSRLTAPELLAGTREIFDVTAEYYTVGQSGPIGAAPAAEIVF